MKLQQEDGIGLILQYSLTRMCNCLAVAHLTNRIPPNPHVLRTW